MENESFFQTAGFFTIMGVIALVVIGVQSIPDADIRQAAQVINLTPGAARMLLSAGIVVAGAGIPPLLLYADLRDGRARVAILGLFATLFVCLSITIYCGTSLIADLMAGRIG